MRKFLLATAVALATIIGIISITPEAHAQSVCAEAQAVYDKLSDDYDESRIATGVQNSSRIFETWANLENGTWTILMTRSNGTSCIMATGQNFQLEEIEESGIDS